MSAHVVHWKPVRWGWPVCGAALRFLAQDIPCSRSRRKVTCGGCKRTRAWRLK